MTDVPLPDEMLISIEVDDGKKMMTKFGDNGGWNPFHYKEDEGIYDDICIDKLTRYVPSHWYGFTINSFEEWVSTKNPCNNEDTLTLEYHYTFLREILKKGIDVWYIKTWVGDIIKEDEITIKEINIANYHFLDESKLPERFGFEQNVFYRFVLK